MSMYDREWYREINKEKNKKRSGDPEISAERQEAANAMWEEIEPSHPRKQTSVNNHKYGSNKTSNNHGFFYGLFKFILYLAVILGVTYLILFLIKKYTGQEFHLDGSAPKVTIGSPYQPEEASQNTEEPESKVIYQKYGDLPGTLTIENKTSSAYTIELINGSGVVATRLTIPGGYTDCYEVPVGTYTIRYTDSSNSTVSDKDAVFISWSGHLNETYVIE